jgi:hypothetical protein
MRSPHTDEGAMDEGYAEDSSLTGVVGDEWVPKIAEHPATFDL